MRAFFINAENLGGKLIGSLIAGPLQRLIRQGYEVHQAWEWLAERSLKEMGYSRLEALIEMAKIHNLSPTVQIVELLGMVDRKVSEIVWNKVRELELKIKSSIQALAIADDWQNPLVDGGRRLPLDPKTAKFAKYVAGNYMDKRFKDVILPGCFIKWDGPSMQFTQKKKEGAEKLAQSIAKIVNLTRAHTWIEIIEKAPLGTIVEMMGTFEADDLKGIVWPKAGHLGKDELLETVRRVNYIRNEIAHCGLLIHEKRAKIRKRGFLTYDIVADLNKLTMSKYDLPFRTNLNELFAGLITVTIAGEDGVEPSEVYLERENLRHCVEMDWFPVKSEISDVSFAVNNIMFFAQRDDYAILEERYKSLKKSQADS